MKTMKKKILAMVIAVAVILGIIPTATVTAVSSTPSLITARYGTNGRENFIAPIDIIDPNDPQYAEWIPISNREELETIADIPNEKFYLTADIDLAGANWVPIGANSDNPFRGEFDGQGYVISNMTITGNYQYVGLFGCADDVKIKNVGLENTNIDVTYVSFDRDEASAGGFVGSGRNSNISNCYNMGEITVSTTATNSSAYASGIGGNIRDGIITSNTISNCYNTSNVSAISEKSNAYAGGIGGSSITNCYNTGNISASADSYSYAGGICGYSYNISNCYNTGNVSASSSSSTSSYNSYAGGICGYSSSGSNINNCYNTGNVSSDSYSASSYAGGINGYISGSRTGTVTYSYISRCYNIGNVSASTSAYTYTFAVALAGGIFGDTGMATTITNCYGDPDNSETPFEGFDFDTIWVIIDGENNNYPVLRCFYACHVCGEINCETEHVQCDVCKKWDCTDNHILCDICNKYDCGINHNIITLPTDPCADCDLCTAISSGETNIKGRILGTEEPTIFDALEVLKCLVGMDGAIAKCGNSLNAALITEGSQENGTPTIFDALEILKKLVGMSNLIDG